MIDRVEGQICKRRMELNKGNPNVYVGDVEEMGSVMKLGKDKKEVQWYRNHTVNIDPETKQYTSNSNKIIVMNQTNGGNTGPGRSWKHMLTYTIGGSTTDERWIDENLTWSHLLQEILRK